MFVNCWSRIQRKHVPIERHLLSFRLQIARFPVHAFRCKAEDRDAMKHVDSHLVNSDNGRD